MLAVLRFATFQAAWFGTIVAAANGVGGIGVAVGVTAAIFATATAASGGRRTTAVRILLMAAAGATAETLVGVAGLCTWASPATPAWICPPWLIGVWLLFVSLGTPLFRTLRGRPALAAILGAALGPPSYLGAERLGAVDLAGTTAVLAIAVQWAMALPAAALLLGSGQDRARPASTARTSSSDSPRGRSAVSVW